ncbi:hypothetical protein L596_011477 [Steinernema carpocapsae]|uniref:Transmembrane protein n=1 Tax=Steinernema carpocapsae TaxID=34508 RepID=A0A4U5NUY6_STECR|nr:hypothetical protein L596_011477 [Steinernema carpocapsae]
MNLFWFFPLFVAFAFAKTQKSRDGDKSEVVAQQPSFIFAKLMQPMVAAEIEEFEEGATVEDDGFGFPVLAILDSENEDSATSQTRFKRKSSAPKKVVKVAIWLIILIVVGCLLFLCCCVGGILYCIFK